MRDFDTTRIIGKVDFCEAVPATELSLFKAEVDAKECFASHFMSDFLAGKGGGFAETVLPGLEGECLTQSAQRARREKVEVVRTLCALRDLRVRFNSPLQRVPFLTRVARSGATTMRSPARIRTPRTMTSADISRG